MHQPDHPVLTISSIIIIIILGRQCPDGKEYDDQKGMCCSGSGQQQECVNVPPVQPAGQSTDGRYLFSHISLL